MRALPAIFALTLASVIAAAASADVITTYGPGPVAGGGGSTWSPSDHGPNLSTSGGDLILSATGEGFGRSTTSKSSGKSCVEVTSTTASGTNSVVGFANATADDTSFVGNTNSFGYAADGAVYINGAFQGAPWIHYTTGDKITLQLDYATTPGSIVVTTKANGVANTGPSSYTWTPSSGSLSMFVAGRPYTSGVETAKFSGLSTCDAGFTEWG